MNCNQDQCQLTPEEEKRQAKAGTAGKSLRSELLSKNIPVNSIFPYQWGEIHVFLYAEDMKKHKEKIPKTYMGYKIVLSQSGICGMG